MRAMRPGRSGPVLGVSWLLTRALLATVAIHDLYRPRWLHSHMARDVSVDYYRAARSLAAGRIPYLGFHYEYPPGTLPLVALSRLLSGADAQRFTVAWIALVLAADLLTLVVLARWARQRALMVGMVWVLGVAAMGPVALLRNDLFVAAAFVVGAWWVCIQRPVRGGAMWGVGILLKLWPAIPLALVVAGRREGRWRLAGGAVAALAVGFGAVAATGALRPMLDYLSAYQGERPLEVESMWANIGWLYAVAVGHHLHPQLTFQSFNLISPRTLRLAAFASRVTAVFQAGLVAAVLVVRRRVRRDLSLATLAWVWLAALCLSFVLTPVLSPQYALWLVGAGAVLLALDDGHAARRAAVVVLAVTALSQLLYPFAFTPLLRGEPFGVLTLTARNGAILLLLGLAVTELVRRWRRLREPAPAVVGAAKVVHAPVG